LTPKTVAHHSTKAGQLQTLLDASNVANTSWLRAFLWAFALTLRSPCVETMGHNPMPLLLMDDPQATFDHCNERQWAQLLAEMTTTPEGEGRKSS
jgi:hypothetical protein